MNCIRIAKRNKVDSIVLFLYALFIFSLLFNVFVKIKYLFLLSMLCFIFIEGKLRITKEEIICMSFLLLHCILFGFILSPKEYLASCANNAISIILFLLITYFSAKYFYEHKLIKEVIVITQILVTGLLTYRFFANFPGLAPIRFFIAFFTTGVNHRYTTLGFGYLNNAGYTSLVDFFVTFMMWQLFYKNRGHSRTTTVSTLYIIYSFAISFLCLFTVMTRGAIILIILFLAFFYLNRLRRKIFKKSINTVIIFIFCILAIVLFFVYVYNEGNTRSVHLQADYKIFIENGNLYFGLGYQQFSAFLNQGFNYYTNPMDCYYLYILCTTGYVGFIIQMIPLLYLLVVFLRNYRNNSSKTFDIIIFDLYFCILFGGVTESLIIDSYHMMSYFYWILFFYQLNVINGRRKNGQINK